MSRPFTTFGNKPRKPLAPFSAKRLAEHDRRAEVVQIVRERDSWCRLNPRSVHYPRVQIDALMHHGVLFPLCGGNLDVHEPLTRARGGNYLDPDDCVLLCRQHHDWVHDHPRAAEKLGLLRHSWDQVSDPAIDRSLKRLSDTGAEVDVEAVPGGHGRVGGSQC